MKTYPFFDKEIIILSNDIKPYIDYDNRRIALLSKEDDSLFGTIELNQYNNLFFKAQWNLNIEIIDHDTVEISVHTQED